MNLNELAASVGYLQLLLTALLVFEPRAARSVSRYELFVVGIAFGVSCMAASVPLNALERKECICILVSSGVTFGILVRSIVKRCRPEERFFENVVRRELQKRS